MPTIQTGKQKYDEAFTKYHEALMTLRAKQEAHAAHAIGDVELTEARRIFDAAHNALTEIEDGLISGRI